MFKQYLERLAIRGEHLLVFFGSASLGAAASYLQLQSSETLYAALSNEQVAEHLAAGAGVAAFIAIVALAKKSFLLPAPPPGGAS